MVYLSIDVPVTSIPAFLSLLGKRAFIARSSWDHSRNTVVPEIFLPPTKSQARLLSVHFQPSLSLVPT